VSGKRPATKASEGLREMDYWFPAKRSGFGWGPPTKWQGWLFLFGWIFVLAGGTRSLGYESFRSLVFFGGMIAVMLLVISFKGEPRRLS
jgi:hypothetical protein